MLKNQPCKLVIRIRIITNQISKEKKRMAKLLNVQEASKILNASPNTIRKWVQQRRIPFVKIGTLVRFKEEDLIRISCEGLK